MLKSIGDWADNGLPLWRDEQYVNGIRTITLDLDDTLWEIHPVIRRAERVLRQWMAEHYPRVVQIHAVEDVAELRAEVISEFGDRSHDLTFIRRTILARMADAAGYEATFVDEAFEVFDRERNTLELFPEVLPALQSLSRRYTLVAVTNGNARLDRIGIDALFDDFVSARTAGAAKPARTIFDAAVSAGGAEPHQTLHVGDHPEYDVDGARSAGLKTAWMNRNGHDWPGELPLPNVVVSDLLQLQRMLGDAERER